MNGPKVEVGDKVVHTTPGYSICGVYNGMVGEVVAIPSSGYGEQFGIQKCRSPLDLQVILRILGRN